MPINTALAAPSPEERPVCQEHQERVAVGTCTRCGRFVCESCVGPQRFCPACVQHQLLSLPSSAPRAQWATRFLSARAAVEALSILLSLGMLASGPSVLLNVARGLVGLATFGVLIATAVAFLRWLHLVVRQTEALEINVGATPGAAVGVWFVPIYNLRRPYRIIRKILDGLGGKPLVGSAHVGLWWGVWLAGNLFSQTEMRMTMRGELDPTSSGALAVGILANLLSIAGAFLCIRIVRIIQQALDERRP
ncbi:MAG: DUF4328 domain-containing protein [Archangium sp.]